MHRHRGVVVDPDDVVALQVAPVFADETAGRRGPFTGPDARQWLVADAGHAVVAAREARATSACFLAGAPARRTATAASAACRSPRTAHRRCLGWRTRAAPLLASFDIAGSRRATAAARLVGSEALSERHRSAVLGRRRRCLRSRMASRAHSSVAAQMRRRADRRLVWLGRSEVASTRLLAAARERCVRQRR